MTHQLLENAGQPKTIHVERIVQEPEPFTIRRVIVQTNDPEDAHKYRLLQAAELMKSFGYTEQPDGTFKPPEFGAVSPDTTT